ncbi:MAG: hypothetical protein LBV74_22460 [Tannerella sp.]|nr:hypothetical protein [Tannerella sp.]
MFARNVIWNLHRPENKGIATNKEVLLYTVNREGLVRQNYCYDGYDANNFVYDNLGNAIAGQF